MQNHRELVRKICLLRTPIYFHFFTLLSSEIGRYFCFYAALKQGNVLATLLRKVSLQSFYAQRRIILFIYASHSDIFP
jgi:hypothetical protein